MKTLICTVGGSSAPVVTAIRDHRPEKIVFVCSEDDVATGRRGSYTETSRILSDAGVPPDAAQIVRVPADGPAEIIAVLNGLVARAVADGDCVGDYTGGTKSMSAALFFVVAQTAGARLSLVSGPRANLQRVEAGERVRSVPTASVRRGRLREQVAACWERHSYAEAERLIVAAPPEVRDATCDRWEHLSRGFARWDAWDHPGALAALDPFGRFAGAHLPALRVLAGGRVGAEEEGQRVVDMYLSAERRALAHQFDAAVLRIYRSLEWIAQWTLRWHNNVDTSDVSRECAIAKHATEDEISGKLVLSCVRAWRAVSELDGPLREIATEVGRSQRVRTLAELRNHSLLAHGQRALARADYESACAALEPDLWKSFTKAAPRVRTAQLPTGLPEDAPP